MQVHRNEGGAIHIGPESCAGGREAVREALTGERVGQPWNRENDASRVPTFFLCAEGNMSRRDRARAGSTRRGLKPWHARTLLVREPGGLGIGHSGMPQEHEVLWGIYAALESSLIDGQVNVVRWRAPEIDSCLGAPHILMLSSRLRAPDA